MEDIKIVPIEQLDNVIETRQPLGLFLSRGKRNGRKRGMFVAVDNTTGDTWTEEFESLQAAEHWLRERD